MSSRLAGSAVLMLVLGCLLGIVFTLPLAQRPAGSPVAAQAGPDLVGCASKRTGQVRLLSASGRRVGSRRPRRCRRSEVALNWSVAAPQGSPGPAGEQGPPGPSTGPAGGALTGSYPNPGLNPATAILNQSAQPQQGSLFLTGQLRTAGGLRLGSETGTAQPPLYPPDSPGLVIRPIQAAGSANGAVLARIGTVSLVRNGDDLLNLSTGQPPFTYHCIHIVEPGTVESTRGTFGASGDRTIMNSIPDTSLIVESLSVRCTVRAPNGHHGEFVLSRTSTSTVDWQGFVVSTTNQ